MLVFGHSAGGHLAACMLATDWKAAAPEISVDLVPAAYSISGLFDLAPLVGVTMNQDLRLDAEEARRVSPLFWPAPAGRIFDAVVGALESAGRRHRDVGARRRHLRGMHRSRLVHGEDAERLQAARPLQHLDHHARALIGDLMPIATQTGHVQEDVGHPIVGNDESVTLGDVEPFDDAGELDDARGLIANLTAQAAVDP